MHVTVRHSTDSRVLGTEGKIIEYVQECKNAKTSIAGLVVYFFSVNE